MARSKRFITKKLSSQTQHAYTSYHRVLRITREMQLNFTQTDAILIGRVDSQTREFQSMF